MKSQPTGSQPQRELWINKEAKTALRDLYRKIALNGAGEETNEQLTQEINRLFDQQLYTIEQCELLTKNANLLLHLKDKHNKPLKILKSFVNDGFNRPNDYSQHIQYFLTMTSIHEQKTSDIISDVVVPSLFDLPGDDAKRLIAGRIQQIYNTLSTEKTIKEVCEIINQNMRYVDFFMSNGFPLQEAIEFAKQFIEAIPTQHLPVINDEAILGIARLFPVTDSENNDDEGIHYNKNNLYKLYSCLKEDPQLDTDEPCQIIKLLINRCKDGLNLPADNPDIIQLLQNKQELRNSKNLDYFLSLSDSLRAQYLSDNNSITSDVASASKILAKDNRLTFGKQLVFSYAVPVIAALWILAPAILTLMSVMSVIVSLSLGTSMAIMMLGGVVGVLISNAITKLPQPTAASEPIDQETAQQAVATPWFHEKHMLRALMIANDMLKINVVCFMMFSLLAMAMFPQMIFVAAIMSPVLSLMFICSLIKSGGYELDAKKSEDNLGTTLMNIVHRSLFPNLNINTAQELASKCMQDASTKMNNLIGKK